MIQHILSLFSGCGGLDLGLHGDFEVFGQHMPKNSLETVWANDVDPKACLTFSHNFTKTHIVCDDIVSLLERNTYLPEVEVVTGGFPCQDFSVSGKRQGLTVDRGKLYLSMLEVIKRVGPKVFVAENVKGLLSMGNGVVFQTILDDFRQLDYNVEFKLLNMADFGVPQHRERLIIIGLHKTLKKQIIWPISTHSSATATMPMWRTSFDAIGDLEDDDIHFSLTNSGYSKAKLTPNTQGNKPICRDKPSPTIRAEHHGNIEYHYSLPRRLSARETARIQSFPDDFIFLQSTSDAYRQIGNAIAPLFGWHLGKMLSDLFK